MAAMLDQLRAIDTDRPVARIGHGENMVTINLSAQSGRSYVRSDPVVSWECSADTLRRAADLISPLLNSTGHQFVDASGVAEEIVISANEYPAHFGR